MNILHFNTLPSTYTYVADNARSMAHATVVAADFQTSGRGQRGNTWEAEAGKNILATILVRMPSFPAKSQFLISETVSLAIIDAIREHTGLNCLIKWPNDIYIGNKKLAGILISHSLAPAAENGETAISHSVIGFGINVNQETFHSDAPNPVSLTQITGQTYLLTPLLETIARTIISRLESLNANSDITSVTEQYLARLWRNDAAPHPFYDVQTGETFNARIYAVEPSGHIILQRWPDGLLARYAFKEVTWL